MLGRRTRGRGWWPKTGPGGVDDWRSADGEEREGCFAASPKEERSATPRVGAAERLGAAGWFAAFCGTRGLADARPSANGGGGEFALLLSRRRSLGRLLGLVRASGRERQVGLQRSSGPGDSLTLGPRLRVGHGEFALLLSRRRSLGRLLGLVRASGWERPLGWLRSLGPGDSLTLGPRLMGAGRAPVGSGCSGRLDAARDRWR